MKSYRVILVFVIFALIRTHPLFAGLPVTGGVDLLQKWYTMENEHFRVCFPLRLKELAGLIKDEAEEAYQDLNRWAGYTIEEKIDIVITDNSDLANGFVRSGSRGLYITLFAVLPYQDFVEGSDAYRNWYRNILIHELAHIVHHDRIGGFPRALNSIFGRLLYPNAASPRFYSEGFAIYAETIHDDGYGRADYPYTDMYVKTAIREKNIPLLDRSSSENGVWPAGTRPYLFGASFVDYLARTYGERTLHEYNEESSKRILFKGGLSFRSVYGKPLREAWEDWLKSEREKVRSSAHEEKTTLSALSRERGWVYSIAVSTKKHLAVYSVRPVDRLGGLYLYDFARQEERCIKRGLYAENLQFSRDDGTIYYIRGDLRKNVYYENNVYQYDIKSGREKQLTTSGHIQGFVLTGSDGEMLAVTSTPYATEIRLISQDGETKAVLKEKGKTPLLPVVEQPSLSPDGTTVAFSCKDNYGRRCIYTVPADDLAGGEARLRRVTSGRQNAYSPSWHSSESLLWTGDRGGLYSIYRTNLRDGSVQRITEAGTGVFDPEPGPEGSVLLREYTSEGFRVSATQVSSIHRPERGETVAAEGGPPVDPDGVLFFRTEVGPGSQPGAKVPADDTFRDYDPGPYLLPGYWSPLFFDDRVGCGFGFFTSSKDLLQRHAYRVGVLYDLFDTKLKSLVDYMYYSYPFDFFVSVFASQRTDTGIFSPGLALFPGISFPLFRRYFALKADLGAVIEPPLSGIDLSFLYSDAASPLHWIGPEKGIVFEQGLYCNLAPEPYLIISDSLSWYIRILDPFLLNFRLLSKWDPFGAQERIKTGAYSEYVFAPLNGVYTRGYPDVVPAKFAVDLKTVIGFPLMTVDRGFNSFPFFFEGAILSFFLDSGIAFSTIGSECFLVQSFQDLLDDPAGHIRSSIGPQLELDFIVGYDYPLTAKIGYVYPLSSGGSSGVFLDMDFKLAF